MWSPNWEFQGWYVNLQEPLWRTRWGFDIRDLQLDILVSPDWSWRWKDEDDLARSVDCGLINAENAAQTRASAAEAIALIESRSWPLDAEAKDWRPPAEWTRPALPEGAELGPVLRWSPEDGRGRY
jgi:predicted RNA-binding protein associated with RNAse of E/G family